MAVRKSGGRYTVEFMLRGVRVFRRLPGGVSASQARALESRLRNQIFSEVDLGRRSDPPLTGVIDEWIEERVSGRKAERATRSHAARVGLDCAGVLLSDICEGARRLRLSPDLSPGTKNRRLCILKAVAKFAYQKGYLQENLSGKIQLLPENNARHLYLVPLQVEALLRAAESAEVRAFIAWAAYTGMRQSEILALGPEDILDRAIRIKDSKTGNPRLVPIIRQLRPHLSAVPFRSHKRTLYAGFEVARAKAGLSGLRYHDLRHTAASHLINEGASLYEVGKLLGHRSQQTTARYAHLSLEALEGAMAKLQRGYSRLREQKRKKAA